MHVNPAAYGLYPQDVSLNDVVHSLNQAGFHNEEICMMLSPTHPIASQVKEANIFNSASESSAVTARLIGWLSGFGAVVIPTVGFFIRSQAFFRVLMIRDTPAICSHARTLAGLGFSDDEADRVEVQLRGVSVLVYVACAESAKSAWACEVLRHTGAQESAVLGDNLRSIVSAAAA